MSFNRGRVGLRVIGDDSRVPASVPIGAVIATALIASAVMVITIPVSRVSGGLAGCVGAKAGWAMPVSIDVGSSGRLTVARKAVDLNLVARISTDRISADRIRTDSNATDENSTERILAGRASTRQVAGIVRRGDDAGERALIN